MDLNYIWMAIGGAVLGFLAKKFKIPMPNTPLPVPTPLPPTPTPVPVPNPTPVPGPSLPLDGINPILLEFIKLAIGNPTLILLVKQLMDWWISRTREKEEILTTQFGHKLKEWDKVI